MARPPDLRLRSDTLAEAMAVLDAASVRACAKVIEEEGPQQFLVNLLYVLRECFHEESTA
jgi:hypothetical protein